MIGEVLRSIDGVSSLSVISLVTFVIAFVIVLFATMPMSRDQLEHASRLPLEDSTGEQKEGESGE